MADDMSRVELGFDSGLIVITKLDAGEWAKLEAALDAGKGVVKISGPDDTTYHIDVSKVGYVKREAHVGHVLGSFSKREREEFDVMVEDAADAVVSLIDNGLEATQSSFNRSAPPST